MPKTTTNFQSANLSSKICCGIRAAIFAPSPPISCQRFANRLSNPKNDPYRDRSLTTVQVQGYLALSNCEFYFETIVRVVPHSMVPNGRSGVILGQWRQKSS